jgi:hypothetical protein
MESMLAAVREGGAFKVVLLLRLGPVPSTWLNYGCGLPDDVTLLPYLGGTVLGNAPANLIACYLGRAVTGIASLLECDWFLCRPALPRRTRDWHSGFRVRRLARALQGKGTGAAKGAEFIFFWGGGGGIAINMVVAAVDMPSP